MAKQRKRKKDKANTTPVLFPEPKHQSPSLSKSPSASCSPSKSPSASPSAPFVTNFRVANFVEPVKVPAPVVLADPLPAPEPVVVRRPRLRPTPPPPPVSMVCVSCQTTETTVYFLTSDRKDPLCGRCYHLALARNRSKSRQVSGRPEQL